MRGTVFLFFFSLVVFVNAEEEKYTTKYDDLDVDEVIKSDRLVSNYVGCLLDANSCTPDATELKSKIIFFFLIICTSYCICHVCILYMSIIIRKRSISLVYKNFDPRHFIVISCLEIQIWSQILRYTSKTVFEI